MRFVKHLLLLLLLGCSTSKVLTDYDRTTDFSKYKTYNFYDDLGKGLNELDVKRVTFALDSVLSSSGFKKTDTPDFLINVIVNYSETNSGNTLNIGFGNIGRNGGIGVSGGIPIGKKKLNEEFILEFVDDKTNELFWEGILNSEVNEKRAPEEKNIHFKNVVKKITEKYLIKY